MWSNLDSKHFVWIVLGGGAGESIGTEGVYYYSTSTTRHMF